MLNESTHPTLIDRTFCRGISELTTQDPGLAGVVSKWGNPPFWRQAPGFPGIVLAILSQQVSLESARAAFAKLEEAIGSIEPEAFLSLDDGTLSAIGFSRQKASYVRGVAREVWKKLATRAKSQESDSTIPRLLTLR